MLASRGAGQARSVFLFTSNLNSARDCVGWRWTKTQHYRRWVWKRSSSCWQSGRGHPDRSSYLYSELSVLSHAVSYLKLRDFVPEELRDLAQLQTDLPR